MVVVFCIVGCFLVLWIAPVVPTCRNDMLAHLAIHEDGGGKWSPRTTEIYLVNSLVGSQLAVVEYISVVLSGWGRGGSDVTVCLAMNLAILKPCFAWTKDEVGGSLNIAVIECDASASYAGINGVLVAKQTAVVYQDVVALCVKGYSLS